MSETDSKKEATINQLEWLIQLDLGHRGIHHAAGDNLCSHSRGNLLRAVKFLVEHQGCTVGIVTGFFVPTGDPPSPESDGPPGALLLASGLNLLGYPVVLITDKYCRDALTIGMEIFHDQLQNCDLLEFPFEAEDVVRFENDFFLNYPDLKCLISIERVGPCHTRASFSDANWIWEDKSVDSFKKHGPGKLAGECLNMRAVPITQYTAPIYRLFESRILAEKNIYTVGIGDGGNEIGMGSIPWRVIANNIRNGLGGKIACRVRTDATIVAGVSNWAGYALTAGLFHYLNRFDDFLKIYSETSETKLIETYFQTRRVVDGNLGYPAMSVDAIEWEIHLQIIDLIIKICQNSKSQIINPK